MLNPKNYIDQEFLCKRPQSAHWGVILKEGAYYKVVSFGERETSFYTNREAYWREFKKFTKSHSEMSESEIKEEKDRIKKNSDIIRELSKKYKINVKRTYIVVTSEFKTNETFYLETVEDIVEKYDLDRNKKHGWTDTHRVFKEYFETKPLQREIRLDKLLN